MNGEAPTPRVAVLGAGVIGSVLAALLHRGGIDTALVARGETLDRLRRNGVALTTRGTPEQVAVPIADAGAPGTFDVVLLAVRANQLDGVLPIVEAMGEPVVVPLMHLGDRWPDVVARFGNERVVRAFPGLGGAQDAQGAVAWLDLGSKQPTTIDGRAPRADLVERILTRTGLPVGRTEDMDGWMQAHVVFVATMGAGVVHAGGDVDRLARDRRLLNAVVDATRDGFHALTDRGIRIAPRPIEVLYLRMPRWFAVAYWRRALSGPVGRLTMAPHAMASRDDEMPLLWRETLRLTQGGPTGAVSRLLDPLLVQAGRP